MSDANMIFQSTHRSERFDESTCALTPLMCQLSDAVLLFGEQLGLSTCILQSEMSAVSQLCTSK